MLETNPSPVFIQLFKPLFSFRILSLLKDSQITETMPVPSSRVKDDFFWGGGGVRKFWLVHTHLLSSQTHFADPKNYKVNQIYIKITMIFS